MEPAVTVLPMYLLAADRSAWGMDYPTAACELPIPWTACARHHTTGQWYRRVLREQGGVCALCGGCAKVAGEPVPLCIDHDHSCCERKNSCGRCVRGLLCSLCGGPLGYVEDGRRGGYIPELNRDPEWVARANAYLARYEAMVGP